MDEYWPSLSFNTNAGILELVAQASVEKPVSIMLALDFANNGLFCEWAYVVDLDSGVYEVFGGDVYKHNTDQTRFKDVGGIDNTIPNFMASFSRRSTDHTGRISRDHK